MIINYISSLCLLSFPWDKPRPFVDVSIVLTELAGRAIAAWARVGHESFRKFIEFTDFSSSWECSQPSTLVLGADVVLVTQNGWGSLVGSWTRINVFLNYYNGYWTGRTFEIFWDWKEWLQCLDAWKQCIFPWAIRPMGLRSVQVLDCHSGCRLWISYLTFLSYPSVYILGLCQFCYCRRFLGLVLSMAPVRCGHPASYSKLNDVIYLSAETQRVTLLVWLVILEKGCFEVFRRARWGSQILCKVALGPLSNRHSIPVGSHTVDFIDFVAIHFVLMKAWILCKRP